MAGHTSVTAALACLALLASAGPVAAQVADTMGRRLTPAEWQAQRRAWLEARRHGAIGDLPPTYGAATVGAPGVPGPLGGTPLGPGIRVICHGWLTPAAGFLQGMFPYAPGLSGGLSFNGDCQPVGGGGAGYPGAYGPGPYEGPGWGAREYGWNGWGWSPLGPFGWSAGPGAGYEFPWPGVAAGDCMRLRVAPAGAPPIDLMVGLRSLGIADPADFDLAIEARLARGLPVDLFGVDGRWIRLDPGVLLDDIRAYPCERR